MFIKKIFFIIFFTVFISLDAISEELTNGILFKSSTERIDQRTSLNLFEKTPQCFDDFFALDFDLSIWDIKQFGYILRIINEENQEISLVFVTFRGEDNLFLDFNSTITDKSVQVPVNKNDLSEKKWLHIRLEFDLLADNVRLFLEDKVYKCSNIGLDEDSRIKFVYGLYGINLDVPRMAIRNIRIEEKGKQKFVFPLNESSGEDIHDNKNRVLGYVKNPDWIINHHYHWNQKTKFRSECTAGITYDYTNNRIFVINRDSIIIYYPGANRVENRLIEHMPFTIFSGEAIYDPGRNKCYIYNLDQENTDIPSLAIIDMENFSYTMGKPILRNSLHHHNVFLGRDGLNPYIFGGYGKFSYSDKVIGYNAGNDSWDTLKLTGDAIIPRFFSASGLGPEPSEILIFGGFGNESGKQELGGRNLYDLYSLNTQTMEVKKKWEIQKPSDLFVPCGNLVLNEEKTHFYTLCYPHHLAHTALHLYKFSLEDGSWEIVSDSVPLLSEKINTRVYLFFNDQVQEFYAVVREYINDYNSEVRIYSLFSPPVSKSRLESLYPASSGWSGWMIFTVILIVVILVILPGSYYFFVRRKKKPATDEMKLTVKELTQESRKNNAIYVLGDFTAYDKTGTDITYRFSLKLKHLFALILLNSKDNVGISTEKLTTELWPDREVTEAKNIRGVTINHLRNILMDIDGIELVHKSSRWFFVVEDLFYCDYLQCVELMSRDLSQENESSGLMDELLSIIRKGSLFPGIQVYWIDSYKMDYEVFVENFLRTNLNNYYETGNYKKVVELSDAYFMIDPLNEEVLSLCIRSLRKTGKIKQSQITYTNFYKLYSHSMGEEYGKSYQAISLDN